MLSRFALSLEMVAFFGFAAQPAEVIVDRKSGKMTKAGYRQKGYLRCEGKPYLGECGTRPIFGSNAIHYMEVTGTDGVWMAGEYLFSGETFDLLESFAEANGVKAS
jgi:hypothetical protein